VIRGLAGQEVAPARTKSNGRALGPAKSFAPVPGAAVPVIGGDGTRVPGAKLGGRAVGFMGTAQEGVEGA